MPSAILSSLVFASGPGATLYTPPPTLSLTYTVPSGAIVMSPSTAGLSPERSRRRNNLPDAGSTASNAALPESSLGKPEKPGIADVLNQTTLRRVSQETASVGQRFASAGSGISVAPHSVFPPLFGGVMRNKLWCCTLETKKDFFAGT